MPCSDKMERLSSPRMVWIAGLSQAQGARRYPFSVVKQWEQNLYTFPLCLRKDVPILAKITLVAFLMALRGSAVLSAAVTRVCWWQGLIKTRFVKIPFVLFC